MKTTHYIQKHMTSMAVVTGLLFSPMLTGVVSAQGAPEAETSQSQTGESHVVETSDPIDYFAIGDHGQGVKALQTALQNRGYTLAADKLFGPETKHAVINFQKANDLKVDGFAGPETRGALSLSNTNVTADKTDSGKDETLVISEKANGNADVASIASNLIGSPYEMGGQTPNGFDSSGFVNYVFDQAGISLDRTHADMWKHNGEFVDNPSVGDVVFFEGTYKDGVSHSGIYIGDNKMIHAGTEETDVETTSLNYDYWQKHYIGAKSFK